MTHKDETGLAWHGRAPESRPGGFVDGVTLNQPRKALAVDPSGVVQPESEHKETAGPVLKVERLQGAPSSPVQRNGRVRLTST